MQSINVKSQLKTTIPEKELTMTEFLLLLVIDLIFKKAACSCFFFDHKLVLIYRSSCKI